VPVWWAHAPLNVYDRNASIAEGASFANGCQLAPSLTQPLSHPQWPSGTLTVLNRLFHSARVGSTVSVSDIQWLLKWSKLRSKEEFLASLRASHALISASLDRLQFIAQTTGIAFDRSAGQMLLLKKESDRDELADKLDVLKEMGVVSRMLSPDEARALEPALNTDAPLHSAVYFPQDEVGNCRQFAQLLRGEAQQLGAQFFLGTVVKNISANPKPTLAFANASDNAAFDLIVVCTGDDPAGLLAALQVQGRCASVQSYSLSLPIREPLNAPRSALFDTTHRVSITRNGGRLRVSGGAELGNATGKHSERAIRQLYNALHHYFPGAANFGQGAQTWKGSSLFTSDALPLVGPSPMTGIYMNVGHGNNGWGMACGSARLVSDLIANKATAVEAGPFHPLRFRT
jgi:D-amino-acid dehydrogenase